MGYQKVFKRYELKYLLTEEQRDKILMAMEPFMEMDRYGESTIRNIYFDTDGSILARRSIMKPDFKEKLRIRSYQKADADSIVFTELKRKYDHVVYKRRIGMPERDAMHWICGYSRGTDPVLRRGSEEAGDIQVSNEIRYFLDYYPGLRPAMFISYDRQAYKMKAPAQMTPEQRMQAGYDRGFRVTFDQNILCRDYDMSLCADVYGKRILPEGKVLMELKCSGGIPLWMTEVLSAEHIYKTSFSKYGTAYTQKLLASRDAFLSAAESDIITSGGHVKNSSGRRRTETRRHNNEKRSWNPAGGISNAGAYGRSL